MSIPNSTMVAPKSQADFIFEMQARTKRRFTLGVVVSCIVLLAILGFLFSSVNIQLGNFTFKTIHLNKAFIQENIPFIASGVWATIGISVLSIILATILALFTALGRLSKFPPLYAMCNFYVSLIRGTPLYLQIFFFFLALPQVGIILPGLWAGVLALGLNYGAYMSEIFRAGLSSVGKGQREAALAIGMTSGQMMRRIVIPQALRFAIPPTGNEFIAMLKDSALVSATGFVHEIMWRATKVGRAQFHNLEALIIAAVFYWVMTLVFSYFQSRLEFRMSRGEVAHDSYHQNHSFG
ncbi:MAG: amino acid ABC transporter permease [Anaerolineales bacterium]